MPSWGESGVVHDVGSTGDDLDILGRDDFKTLAHAVVVRGYAAIVGLPLDVAAKHLFKLRSGRGKRSHPVRRLGLCCGHRIDQSAKNPLCAEGNLDEKQSTMETKKGAV